MYKLRQAPERWSIHMLLALLPISREDVLLLRLIMVQSSVGSFIASDSFSFAFGPHLGVLLFILGHGDEGRDGNGVELAEGLPKESLKEQSSVIFVLVESFKLTKKTQKIICQACEPFSV